MNPPAPLLLPRGAKIDVEVCGWTVPKGAQVLINEWAIGRSWEVWEDAHVFSLERFLDSDIDVKGRHFKLTPFGNGRRICLGSLLAVRMLHLMLGSLVNSFDWKLENNMEPKDMDMDQSLRAIHVSHCHVANFYPGRHQHQRRLCGPADDDGAPSHMLEQHQPVDDTYSPSLARFTTCSVSNNSSSSSSESSSPLSSSHSSPPLLHPRPHPLRTAPDLVLRARVQASCVPPWRHGGGAFGGEGGTGFIGLHLCGSVDSARGQCYRGGEFLYWKEENVMRHDVMEPLLLQGIPEQAEAPLVARAPAGAQPAYPTVADAPQTTQPAPITSTGPNANPLDLFPAFPMWVLVLLVLAHWISYATFQALRAMVQANPQILQPMLQELNKQNPHLMRLIQDHQVDFLRLINEPVKALSTVVHLINRLPSPSISYESPFTRLFGHPPDYSTLRIFGCACYVHLPPHERTKLTAQSVECAFLGYSPHQKGFLCYDPNLHRIRVSRNVIFLESVYFFANHHDSFSSPISVLPLFSNSSADTSLDVDPVQAPELEPAPLRRSSCIGKPPERYICSMTATLSSIPIPSSYKQAMHNECLKKAIESELLALEENQTWDIMPCPPSVKPLGSKFVFSIKLRSDGSINRYKARLVVLGNKQEYGLDYDETFALVAKITTMRTILALVTSKSWPLHQMDVKNAFLHGDLKEEVYITLPGGMSTLSPNTVFKLKRSLYGLKQAPRVWFEKFRSTLLGFSFNQSQYDPSLFLQRTPKGIVVLLVYVDDIVVTGSDQDVISRIKQMLNSTFHMKELGHLNYFLGLELHYHPEGIFVNQHKYIQDLVQLAGLTNATPVDTPMEVNVKYRRHEGELLDDPTQYRKLVGCLLYVTITRPDISYVVHTVSKFMQSPRHFHFSAVQHIIKYLLGTSSRGLFFPGNSSLQLQAYSDVDWAGCPDTWRSTIGWCMFLGNAPISWKSEYRAMSITCSEITWLRGLLTKLGVSQAQPTPLHADNTKAYDHRVITLPHVSTTIQIADIFTKSLPRQRHNFLLGKLMLVDSPASI
ncbi:hypothetical protein V8G54_006257 [Vigna mungo]|uniref:Uncharacterized protein n=1 Tax=Vigna mungo TaxID=3915 RepID=A0AAQ3NZP1_VIGMU